MSEREQAARRGEVTYQGRPCRRGHAGVRYVRNGDCIDCARLTAHRQRERIRNLRPDSEESADA